MKRLVAVPDVEGISPGADFRKVVSRIEQVPTLPEVIIHVLRLAQDPDVSTHQVAEIVGHDQSMVSSILRMVNSPFYSLSCRITSIQHAVVLLGMRTVRNVALSSVLVKSFGDSSEDKRFDRGLLWKHTVACAIGARLLAQNSRLSEPEEAFLSGLIHDIGLVILDQFFHEDFRRVIDRVAREGETLCQAERVVFGHDHAAVGALLARQWNFPAPVVEAIACHHRPSLAKDDKALSALVHVADYLGRRPDQFLSSTAGEDTDEEAVDAAPDAGASTSESLFAELLNAKALSARGPESTEPDAEADEAGPVRPRDTHPRQVWETEPLDPGALETAHIGPEELAEFRSAFRAEWSKAQIFVNLRG